MLDFRLVLLSVERIRDDDHVENLQPYGCLTIGLPSQIISNTCCEICPLNHRPDGRRVPHMSHYYVLIYFPKRMYDSSVFLLLIHSGCAMVVLLP